MLVMKRRGFSIMETMIAAFVLTVGLVGMVSLFGPAIRHTGDVRDRIIATGLAQEGVEIVRNIRDNNMVAGRDFADGIADGWRCVDYAQRTLRSCGSDGRLFVRQLLYTHAGGAASPYRRKIHIAKSGDAITATAIVIWDDGTWPSSPSGQCTLANKCVRTRVTLTKWQ